MAKKQDKDRARAYAKKHYGEGAPHLRTYGLVTLCYCNTCVAYRAWKAGHAAGVRSARASATEGK